MSRTLLLFLVVIVSVLRAQDPTGVIEGVVWDPARAAIAGARVLVANLETGLTQSVITPPGGLFRFGSLPIGAYSLTVEA